ncbi:hypothetical protein ACFW1A_36570, partial [Kitasatospora sp. NPDC058965]|uniref:hypothetical protein n=1 Tax=Kitasatospora sp. NPDC058965 TaxID=3346682 RepID=UPI0036A2060C
MTSLAAQTNTGVGPFLLVWSLVALAMGGLLATKRWSDRYKSFLLRGLDARPSAQQRADRLPAGFVRVIG